MTMFLSLAGIGRDLSRNLSGYFVGVRSKMQVHSRRFKLIWSARAFMIELFRVPSKIKAQAGKTLQPVIEWVHKHRTTLDW